MILPKKRRIYDAGSNNGFVNVGKNYDTSQFAVNSIRLWWNIMGKEHYPDAHRILITADSGGINGYKRHQWKYELQQVANETGLEISVAHFPPGTSNTKTVSK
jgi:hypothetical protein